MPQVHHYSWAELQVLAKSLAGSIAKECSHIDVVIGISRGGCFPALLLSYLLEIRSLTTIQVMTTVTEAPRSLRSQPSVSGLPREYVIKDRHCLLVDDVTNTGATLAAATAALLELKPSRLVSAALVWDTVSPDPNEPRLTKCFSDFVASEIHAWASFPWLVGHDG